MEKRVQDFYNRKLKAASTDEERSKIITAVVKRCIPEVIEKIEKEKEKEFRRNIFNVNTGFGM